MKPADGAPPLAVLYGTRLAALFAALEADMKGEREAARVAWEEARSAHAAIAARKAAAAASESAAAAAAAAAVAASENNGRAWVNAAAEIARGGGYAPQRQVPRVRGG